MIKKIVLTFFLLLTISACGDDKADKNKASNSSTLESTSSNKNTSSIPQADISQANIPSNGNGEEVELTGQDMLAMDLINDEIFLDECNAHARDNSIDKNEMESYLINCIEQLQLQASIIIDIPDEEKQTEATPPTSSEASEVQK